MTKKASNDSAGQENLQGDAQVTMSQILSAGQNASHLLNSPVYNVAHRLAVDQLIAQWVETHPKEREKRESLYHELRSFATVNQTLLGMIERAHQENEKLQNQQSQNDMNFLDEQGYGLNNYGE